MGRALTIAIVLIVAACGSDGSTTEPPTTEPPTTEPPTTEPPTTEPVTFPYPTAPDAIVVQLRDGVNQPDAVAVASGYPTFTLFGDGRLIVEDRSVDSGALPPLVEVRLTPDGIGEVLALAASSGALDPLDSYGAPNIADADSLGFTIDAGSAASRFGVYALGSERADDEGIDPDQYEARVALRPFVRTLENWRVELAEHVEGEPALFTGDSLLVMGEQYGSSVDQGTLPIDMTTAERFETRVDAILCRTVSGDELDALLPTLLAGDRFTPWVIDGEVWDLALRPVFPGEPGCAIVPDQ